MSAPDRMPNSFASADRDRLAAPLRAMVERRDRLLGPAYRLFYEQPLHIVRGDGVWLEDGDGRRFLDAYNNVACVGHGHPRVVDAVARQLATLNTHTRYLHEAVLDYAEALLATMPSPLAQVMLTCTGSEANDLALRIAQAATGRTGVIVTRNAYHAVTSAVSAFSPSLGLPLSAHVRTVPAPFAGADRFAAAVAAAADDLARAGTPAAMLIVDTIFSSDGVVADPPNLLAEAAAVIRAAGGLFVADEVQAGFGRTGEALWGFARHGVVPDLVTIGKPMGNGYPVAGVVGTAALLDRFAATARYFNTFGGSPVAAAAARAVLGVIADEALTERARVVGARLRDELTALQGRHRKLGAVRGAGLYIGVDVVDAAGGPDRLEAARIVNGLRARGVLIGASGPDGHVLKIRPPLVFGHEHVALLIDALVDTLRVGQARLGSKPDTGAGLG